MTNFSYNKLFSFDFTTAKGPCCRSDSEVKGKTLGRASLEGSTYSMKIYPDRASTTQRVVSSSDHTLMRMQRHEIYFYLFADGTMFPQILRRRRMPTRRPKIGCHNDGSKSTMFVTRQERAFCDADAAGKTAEASEADNTTMSCDSSLCF